MRNHLKSGPQILGLVFWCACSSQNENNAEKVNDQLMVQPPSVTAPLKTPAPAATAKRIDRPLMAATAGLVMIDRVDVANERNEKAHGYKTVQPRALGVRDFDIGKKRTGSQDGHAIREFESFQVTVLPKQDHVLIRAIDASSKGQVLHVSLDGKPAGNWTLPDVGAASYGEASFPIPGSLIGDRSKLDIRLDYAAPSTESNSYIYWLYAQPDKKLVEPIVAKVQGLSLTDRLDVGNKADEATHNYVIEKPTYHGIHEYKWPVGGSPFLEDVRSTKSSEAFRMKVKPGKDHLLVKAFDTGVKDQTTRVFVDGTLAGEWSLPNEKSRYGEATFQIPNNLIGSKTEVLIELKFVSSSKDTNSLYYWLFAQPGGPTG